MPITNTAYIQDANKCFGPIMFPGESYAFYINADEPLSDPNFDTFRLDIMNDATGQVVLTGIGDLEKDEITADFYNIWSSFVCPLLPFGWYRLVIRDTSDDTVKAVSNLINIEEQDKVINTALVAYRNEENKYNFRYEENPDYYNRIRVPLVQVAYKIENDRKQYRNVSDRRLRNLNSYKDFLVTLESYNYNEFGHVAMSSVYDHSDIFVDNHFIIPKENYQIDDERRSAFSKGTIDVYVDLTQAVPAQAIVPDEYLVDNEIDEILAEGQFIIVR
jgi:hypothetical protein